MDIEGRIKVEKNFTLKMKTNKMKNIGNQMVIKMPEFKKSWSKNKNRAFKKYLFLLNI